MKKKYVMSLIAIVLMISIVLLGMSRLSRPVSANQRTTMVFWHSMGGKPADALKKLVAKYNASQTKYTVVPQYQGAYTESLPKYINVANSSAAPAIVQAQEIATSTMLSTKSTEPVSRLLDSQVINQIEDNIARYYTVDNQLQSLPFNSSTPVLYYNKSLVEKLGLKPLPEDPSYQDILNLAQAITEKTNHQTKGMTIEAYGWLFEELTANQNQLLANHDNGRESGQYATKININTPAARRLMTFMKQAIQDKSFVSYGSGDIAEANQQTAFLAGKLGMFMQSSASTGDLQANAKFKLGVTYVPHADDIARNGLTLGGASLWVNKHQTTATKEGVTDFLKFMSSAQSQAQWQLATGYLAVNKNAKALPQVTSAIAKDPNLGVATKQLETSKKNSVTAGPLVPILPIERTNVETAMQSIVNGADIEKSLQTAEDATNKALASYNSANHMQK
ncbi:ABC transporter substrate-binding protein [Leuconostoc citreum]|uniref:ABC transporter substrate-binding protein n=1 Tax=Leuconostoc citreum TaxID=33964 RepID=UPI0021A9271F|nr:ABC transporter substrate-binding protein [Leuconostoc citreum]MCT3056572.1 ABC transporter substrate-binding protein [Leuconostoc citreum]MCT3060313.1 ABC transporter substrate-binding protein [Leuconostoc citreum]